MISHSMFVTCDLLYVNMTRHADSTVFYANECNVLVVHCGTCILILMHGVWGAGLICAWFRNMFVEFLIYFESVTGSCSMNHWINKSSNDQWLSSFLQAQPTVRPASQSHRSTFPTKQHVKVELWNDKTLLFLCWHNPRLWLVGSDTTAGNCNL